MESDAIGGERWDWDEIDWRECCLQGSIMGQLMF